MTTDTSRSWQWREWSLLATILCGALLLSHPYTGIRHDGILYFGDALARLLPGELHDDLYFHYGSQGRFTPLPAAYAWLIASFGIGSGTIAGLLAAFALQIAATLAVVTWLAPVRLRGWCAVSVVLGWSIYGGLRVFAYGEAFLTARSFAEPLVLLGLAALFRGRFVLGAVGLVAGLVVHPLMGAGGFVVAWIWLCFGDRRWLWLGVLGAIVYGLVGWWGHPPFDDVFARYDDTWHALVYEANPQAFVALWSRADLGMVAFASSVLWLAARRIDDGRVRRVAGAALVAGLLCMAISVVGVDLLRNPFLGKLQIWRALWLTQWFAMAVIPLVVVALWRRGEAGKIAALLLTIGWMAPFSIAPVLVAVLALLIDRFGNRATLTASTTRIVGGLVAVTALVIVAQYWARTIKLGIVLDQPWTAIVAQVLAANLLIFAVSMGALRASRRRPWAGAVVAILLVVTGAALWDERGAWTKRLESYAVGTNIWPGLLEPTSTVYWYRDLIAPWILLGHSNYYTQQQGSGAVFSQDMTTELDRRRKVTAILDFQEQLCRMMNNLNEKANSCEPDAEAVRNVCVDSGIDYIVLQSGLDGARSAASFKTGVVENGYEKTFFLYRCSALKSR